MTLAVEAESLARSTYWHSFVGGYYDGTWLIYCSISSESEVAIIPDFDESSEAQITFWYEPICTPLCLRYL